MEVILLHTVVEPRGGAGDVEVGYVIVRSDLRPKRAYCALVEEVRGAARC